MCTSAPTIRANLPMGGSLGKKAKCWLALEQDNQITRLPMGRTDTQISNKHRLCALMTKPGNIYFLRQQLPLQQYSFLLRIIVARGSISLGALLCHHSCIKGDVFGGSPFLDGWKKSLSWEGQNKGFFEMNNNCLKNANFNMQNQAQIKICSDITCFWDIFTVLSGLVLYFWAIGRGLIWV